MLGQTDGQTSPYICEEESKRLCMSVTCEHVFVHRWLRIGYRLLTEEDVENM
jgi:hypothetical protein